MGEDVVMSHVSGISRGSWEKGDDESEWKVELVNCVSRARMRTSFRLWCSAVTSGEWHNLTKFKELSAGLMVGVGGEMADEIRPVPYGLKHVHVVLQGRCRHCTSDNES